MNPCDCCKSSHHDIRITSIPLVVDNEQILNHNVIEELGESSLNWFDELTESYLAKQGNVEYVFGLSTDSSTVWSPCPRGGLFAVQGENRRSDAVTPLTALSLSDCSKELNSPLTRSNNCFDQLGTNHVEIKWTSDMATPIKPGFSSLSFDTSLVDSPADTAENLSNVRSKRFHRKLFSPMDTSCADDSLLQIMDICGDRNVSIELDKTLVSQEEDESILNASVNSQRGYEYANSSVGNSIASVSLDTTLKGVEDSGILNTNTCQRTIPQGRGCTDSGILNENTCPRTISQGRNCMDSAADVEDLTKSWTSSEIGQQCMMVKKQCMMVKKNCSYESDKTVDATASKKLCNNESQQTESSGSGPVKSGTLVARRNHIEAAMSAIFASQESPQNGGRDVADHVNTSLKHEEEIVITGFVSYRKQEERTLMEGGKQEERTLMEDGKQEERTLMEGGKQEEKTLMNGRKQEERTLMEDAGNFRQIERTINVSECLQFEHSKETVATSFIYQNCSSDSPEISEVERTSENTENERNRISVKRPRSSEERSLGRKELTNNEILNDDSGLNNNENCNTFVTNQILNPKAIIAYNKSEMEIIECRRSCIGPQSILKDPDRPKGLVRKRVRFNTDMTVTQGIKNTTHRLSEDGSMFKLSVTSNVTWAEETLDSIPGTGHDSIIGVCPVDISNGIRSVFRDVSCDRPLGNVSSSIVEQDGFQEKGDLNYLYKDNSEIKRDMNASVPASDCQAASCGNISVNVDTHFDDHDQAAYNFDDSFELSPTFSSQVLHSSQTEEFPGSTEMYYSAEINDDVGSILNANTSNYEKQIEIAKQDITSRSGFTNNENIVELLNGRHHSEGSISCFSLEAGDVEAVSAVNIQTKDIAQNMRLKKELAEEVLVALEVSKDVRVFLSEMSACGKGSPALEVLSHISNNFSSFSSSSQIFTAASELSSSYQLSLPSYTSPQMSTATSALPLSHQLSLSPYTSPQIPTTISALPLSHQLPLSPNTSPQIPTTISALPLSHRPLSSYTSPQIPTATSALPLSHRPLSSYTSPQIPTTISALPLSHCPLSSYTSPQIPTTISALPLSHQLRLSPNTSQQILTATSALPLSHRPLSSYTSPQIPTTISALPLSHQLSLSPNTSPQIPTTISALPLSHQLPLSPNTSQQILTATSALPLSHQLSLSLYTSPQIPASLLSGVFSSYSHLARASPYCAPTSPSESTIKPLQSSPKLSVCSDQQPFLQNIQRKRNKFIYPSSRQIERECLNIEKDSTIDVTGNSLSLLNQCSKLESSSENGDSVPTPKARMYLDMVSNVEAEAGPPRKIPKLLGFAKFSDVFNTAVHRAASDTSATKNHQSYLVQSVSEIKETSRDIHFHNLDRPEDSSHKGNSWDCSAVLSAGEIIVDVVPRLRKEKKI